MTQIRILAALFSVFLLLGVVPAVAAEDATAETTPAAESQTKPSPASSNPYIARLDKKAKEIGSKLQPKELEHLYYIREGFGVLRAVYMVKRDVGIAVKACARDNPALRDGIEKRFTDWNAAVEPVMTEKQNVIDAAINGQTYIKPKEIKDYMKLIEQAADYANRSIDKQVVTTPEACNNLAASMDRTQDVVAKLLGELTVKPWPPVDDGSDAEKPVTTPN